MEEKMEVHGGHRERIRARIEAGGLDRLAPHEVLEFLLYYAIPRQDVNRLSHNLLEYFGTLENVLHAELPELMKVEGVGKKAALWLALVGECTLECARGSGKDQQALENFMQVFVYACKLYRDARPPCSVQICMDAASRVSYRRVICESRAWGEAETLRQALSDVLSMRARNVIILQFIGNLHADPDEYDCEHAREYAYALRGVGCTLLDVVLVGDGGMASMRQMGMIPEEGADGRARRMVCERYLENMPDAAELYTRAPVLTEDEDELFDF